MKTEGLLFKKFDLHIHTPASECFTDKNIKPEDIVKMALKKGLDAIAITDHNSGKWIDRVKEAAKSTSLTVFPGVEITVGDAHIHVIAILDKNKTTRDIEDLLGTLKIRHSEYGKRNTFVSKTVVEVIETITSNKFNGLAVPAHIDSSSGVFDQMSGEPRIEIIKHPELLAVEAINYSKVEKFLNGKDLKYQRKLAIYQSSDNPYLDSSGNIIVDGKGSGEHSINGIGYRYSYFKVDKNITLESIRQCFIDPEVRIRRDFEYKKEVYPYIKKVKINSGFLNETDLNFHQGMNSILGAKGAGKSLLIEFLRFVLDQESTQPEIAGDHEEKLSKQLGQYGTVEIIISDETGKEFKIKRNYDPTENYPIECKDLISNEVLDVNIEHLFPVLFLSQTEIIKIAEDTEEQLKFIDKFFDFHRYVNQINDLEREIEKLDKSFAESLEAYHDEKTLNKKLETAKVEKERLSKKLKNPIFDEYSELENKDKNFRMQQNFLNSLSNHLHSFKDTIINETQPDVPKKLLEDPSLKRTYEIIKKVQTQFLEILNTYNEKLIGVNENIYNEYNNWKPAFEDKKEKFQKQIVLLGGNSQELEEKRKIIVKEIERLEEKINLVQKKARQIKEINKVRNEKLNLLKEVYNNYLQERRNKCKFFEIASNGKLLVNIIESTNKDEFRKGLTALKKGSYLRDHEIEEICKRIAPREFIFDLLRYDLSNVNEKNSSSKYIDNIATKTNVSSDKIK
ncbi:MAG: AAA family ATPase, partial [Candidatus Atribacteria bacterium]|nr:AAA family ATPase [Candidatus Atribacteria bacterium]